MGVDRPRRGLVLSGGGARGAYEAGVLRYLLEQWPQLPGAPPRFSIACGTSVGALHACFLASALREGAAAGARLVGVWDAMRIREMASLRPRELLRLPLQLTGLLRPSALPAKLPARLHGVIDASAIEVIVREHVAWPRIRENLRSGMLDALCVTVTEVATGRALAFVQRGAPPAEPPWPDDDALIGRHATLRPVHALASAAIPVLFPAVRIGKSFYADGGLRLNTPLAPALRLGADRVLVISLRRGPAADLENLNSARVAMYDNPLFLYGKVLNALFLDHVEADLRHMHMLNSVLRGGERVYGPEFVGRLNAVLAEEHPQPFRAVEAMVVRPSLDLGVLAGEVMSSPSARSGVPRWVRALARSLGIDEEGGLEADLLSYLLLDRVYTARLTELGYADAQRQHDAFAAFFAD